MSGPKLTPEQEKLAARIADEAKSGGKGTVSADSGVERDFPPSPDDHLAANLAHLARIAGAHRAAQTLPEDPAPGLFEWRHLKVERELDHGGFGTVYQAWDPVLKRRVALKLMQDDRASEQRERRMMAEAQQMARVRHPNVLAVHGAGSADGRTGIWSDLLDGSNLEQTLKNRQPLPVAQVTDMAMALTDALAQVHASGIVHGDIKPANIMIQPDDTPVLMDFGSSSGTSFGPSGYGSPLVMAPEQFVGQAATSASDIYGLGATLYFALKASYPVVADSFEALEKKHQGGALVDYSGLTARWRHLLRSMLHPDPKMRPTAAKVKLALTAIAQARPRFFRRLAVGVVVGSLAAGVLAGALAYRSAEQNRQRTERIKLLVVDSLKASLPTRQSGGPSLESVYQQIRALADERLKDYPEGLAEMKLVAATGFRQLGLIEQALVVGTESHELMLTLPDISPVTLSSSWLSQSGLLKDTGELDGAIAAANEAARVLEGAPSNEQTLENRLIVYNRLATIHSQRGNWHESEAAHQKSLELRRSVYDEDDVRLAVEYHNVATAQASIGDYLGAIENEKAAAQVLERAGHGESVRMGFVLQGLAHTLLQAKQYEESLPVFDAARRRLLVSLPEHHERLQQLKLARWVADYHVGNTDGVVDGLMAMASAPDTPRVIQLRANRWLGDLAILEGRWQAAVDAFEVVGADDNLRMKREKPYFEAAVAYSRYQMDPSSPPPLAAVQQSLSQLRNARLDKLNYFQVLLEWEQSLLQLD